MTLLGHFWLVHHNFLTSQMKVIAHYMLITAESFTEETTLHGQAPGSEYYVRSVDTEYHVPCELL